MALKSLILSTKDGPFSILLLRLGGQGKVPGFNLKRKSVLIPDKLFHLVSVQSWTYYTRSYNDDTNSGYIARAVHR